MPPESLDPYRDLNPAGNDIRNEERKRLAMERAAAAKIRAQEAMRAKAEKDHA